MTVTVCIPSIPPRAPMLARALASVTAQTLQPDAIAVAIDHQHDGAPVTRNRALAAAQTDWVAFLDDDDELLPNHLAELVAAGEETGADLIYPNFRCLDPDGNDKTLPESIRSGQEFDARILRTRSFIPVTTLVRTEIAQRVGGFSYPRQTRGKRYEDWGFYLKLLDVDARFHHHPVTTWIWHHHGANTSGLPGRW